MEGTYDAVRALGTLTVDTTSAAAWVVSAGVHGGCCSGSFVEQKARGAGEDRRKIVGRKRECALIVFAESQEQSAGGKGENEGEGWKGWMERGTLDVVGPLLDF